MLITINIKDNQGNEAKELLLSMDRDFDRVTERLNEVMMEENFCKWCGDILVGIGENFCCEDCAATYDDRLKEDQATGN